MTSVASDWNAVGFEKDSVKLSPSSPYYRSGDDGKDPGVDIDALSRRSRGRPAAAAVRPCPFEASLTAVRTARK